MVVNFLVKRIPQFGPFPTTGAFPKKLKLALTTVDDVLKSSSIRRRRKSAFVARDPEGARAVWDLTIAEQDLKQCDGPFTDEDLDARCPEVGLLRLGFQCRRKGHTAGLTISKHRICLHTTGTPSTPMVQIGLHQLRRSGRMCYLAPLAPTPRHTLLVLLTPWILFPFIAFWSICAKRINILPFHRRFSVCLSLKSTG